MLFFFYTWGVAQFRKTPSQSFQRSKRNTKITQKSENKVERQRNGRKRKKHFLCYHVLREERKAFFQYRPGLDYRRGGYKGEKQSTGENRATLGAGLVSVSGVLVLGVLTLDYRINVNSSNRKRVNSRKSVLGSKVQCTMIPRNGNRKDANTEASDRDTGQS